MVNTLIPGKKPCWKASQARRGQGLHPKSTPPTHTHAVLAPTSLLLYPPPMGDGDLHMGTPVRWDCTKCHSQKCLRRGDEISARKLEKKTCAPRGSNPGRRRENRLRFRCATRFGNSAAPDFGRTAFTTFFILILRGFTFSFYAV